MKSLKSEDSQTSKDECTVEILRDCVTVSFSHESCHQILLKSSTSSTITTFDPRNKSNLNFLHCTKTNPLTALSLGWGMVSPLGSSFRFSFFLLVRFQDNLGGLVEVRTQKHKLSVSPHNSRFSEPFFSLRSPHSKIPPPKWIKRGSSASIFSSFSLPQPDQGHQHFSATSRPN